jgi:3-hydroxyisobutyrate dehydrogenase-like beta-hydroxyacid dehydrogenase
MSTGVKRRVAVVGVGQMGEAMAARLTECGHDVIGFDIHEPTRQRVASSGLAVTSDLGEALRGRDVILSSLPDSAAVRAAWLGEHGIAALAHAGSLCIELSTVDPDTMVEAGRGAAKRGLAVIDCPVSGGPVEARNGTLILIAGGDEATIAHATPFLRDLGEEPRYTGPVGTAKVVKIINNTMAMGNLLMASEAFTVGVAAGVEPARLFEVLSASGGTSRTLTKRFPKALKGDFSPGFKIELAEKDLGLGVALGRGLRLPMPAATLVHQMFGLALIEGHRGSDAVATLAMYQAWAKKSKAQRDQAKQDKS